MGEEEGTEREEEREEKSEKRGENHCSEKELRLGSAGKGEKAERTEDRENADAKIIECAEFMDCTLFELGVWKRQQLDRAWDFGRVHDAVRRSGSGFALCGSTSRQKKRTECPR